MVVSAIAGAGSKPSMLQISIGTPRLGLTTKLLLLGIMTAIL
jgi:hypothetical protein